MKQEEIQVFCIHGGITPALVQSGNWLSSNLSEKDPRGVVDWLNHLSKRWKEKRLLDSSYVVTCSSLCETEPEYDNVNGHSYAPSRELRNPNRKELFSLKRRSNSDFSLYFRKYQRCRLWDRLHEEHINAGRTVQQLRANMREMEKLCLRVRQEDIPVLQRMINPVKEEASFAIKDFLQLHSESAEELKRQLERQEDTSLTRSATVGGEILYNTEVKDGSQSLIQISSRLPEIPQEENAAESWETLEGDLVELSQLVTDFSLLVTSQQEKIDRIEDHVNTAAVNVEEGTKNLGKAAKYKLAALPVAGAVIGGVVGGPIGLLAGFKVAGIAAALGGGILGFTGGKLIQKRKMSRVEGKAQPSPPPVSEGKKTERKPQLD
ncbi:syntaxin-17 [Melanerpes formicivorus]|uniref:syntaxin-17 n=1 Tax=Melanerpes formicivorus TaxID=211600 RepID=UPI00358EBB2F